MADNDKKKICVLFGAGAEVCYGLSDGGTFTVNTLLRKREELYEQLDKIIYKDINIEEFAGKYKKNFLFRKDSTSFKKIFKNTVRKYYSLGDVEDNDVCEKILELYNEEKENDKISANNTKTGKEKDEIKKAKDKIEKTDDIKEKANKIIEFFYKDIIIDLDAMTNDNNVNKNNIYTKLKDYFVYDGAVEQKFSNIINPKEKSSNAFWGLVNYFWSAYMEILIPIVKNSPKYSKNEKFEKNKYEFILNNLKEITEYIYDDIGDFIHNYSYKKDGEYYDIIHKSLEPCYVITTNYTPFVEHYFKNNIAFLAGRLCEFEYPRKLCITDICKNPLDWSELFFPFMMTQAPIKPIIVPEQIKEYNKALEFLNECDVLIIIGYSMSEMDNHINAMIRKFITNKNKKMIYCEFWDKEKTNEKFNENDVIKRIRKCLRVETANNIFIIKNEGNANNLIDNIKLNL